MRTNGTIVQEGSVEDVEEVVRGVGEEVERRLGEGEDLATFVGEV